MRFVVLLMVAACVSKSHKRPRTIITTTSLMVVDACPQSKKIDPKRATKEIEELIGPCTTIPGGKAHFSATLLPDGRVELASPTGDPSRGVVPTCLLQSQSQLRHRLRLTKSCRFDVTLDERH